MRATAILIGLSGAVLLGGCADLMQRSTIAPDWFQAKAQEVKGEGYPVLKDVPEVRGNNSGGVAAWKGEADTLKTQGQELDVKAGQPIPSDDEVRAREAQIRAQLDAGQAADAPKPQP